MTNKEILEEVYRLLSESDVQSSHAAFHILDVRRFIEQEWQKQDEIEETKIRNRDHEDSLQ